MRAPLAYLSQAFSDIYDQRSGNDVTMTNFETQKIETLTGLIYEQFLKKSMFFSTFSELYHF